MEIHGVTFKDYALAGANLANGMPLEKVCQVLSIEEPVWAEVQEFFNNNMSQLEPGGEEMMFYATVFTNPKQGKFANVEGAAGGVEEVLEKYPEWSDCIKMGKYMEHASNVGVDIDFDKEFGISLTQYSQLAGHWSDYYRNKTDVDTNYDIDEGPNEEQIESSRVFDLHTELSDKWDAYYKEKFKNDNIDLSGDIEF